VSEVVEGDFEDICMYNLYRTKKTWRCFCYLGLYATINGYHHFKVKPREDHAMKCVREPGNAFDKNAIQVVIPESLTGDKTVVGRVPRKCAKIISNFIDLNKI